MPRGRVVGATAGIVAASAVIGALLFVGHDRISLSVTRDHALWYADMDRPPDPARSQCRVRREVSKIAGGSVRSWTPRDCRVRPAGIAIYAIGDSHNSAYAPSYGQLSAELGIPIRAYFRAGCPFVKLNEAMDPHMQCASYYAAVFEDLRARVRPGDVIFMPALRLTRFVNQFGPLEFAHDRPDDSVSPAVLAEARDTLTSLSRTGARLLFEAPKPIYRAPIFRCSDWFNRGHPDCAAGFTISRAELERLRGPVRTAMLRLAAEMPAVSVWDPFPILCPADPCRAVDDRGRPQVFDADHLSGHGNDLLYVSLRDALLRGAKPQPARAAPAGAIGSPLPKMAVKPAAVTALP